jgi:hypothetical protein
VGVGVFWVAAGAGVGVAGVAGLVVVVVGAGVGMVLAAGVTTSIGMTCGAVLACVPKMPWRNFGAFGGTGALGSVVRPCWESSIAAVGPDSLGAGAG